LSPIYKEIWLDITVETKTEGIDYSIGKGKVRTENWIRRLLIIAGSLLVGLGIMGIFVPMLPTTPFLLLAAACYARSSPKFYYWLLNNKWFGSYIRNYRQRKGIPLTVKIFTLALLWLTIGTSATFAVQSLTVRIILILIAIGVSIHILTIKTLKR
jgi:uncharacterized membrane protein YbaN (DUF454 family)